MVISKTSTHDVVEFKTPDNNVWNDDQDFVIVSLADIF